MLFLSHFFNDIVRLKAKVEYFRYYLWREIPKLLRPEGKLRKILRGYAFARQVLIRPLDKLDAVHSGHEVVDNHEGHLVLTIIVIKLMDRLGYWAPAVQECCLAPELQLVKKNILKGKLCVDLVLKDDNLRFGHIYYIRKADLIYINLIWLFLWKDFGLNVYNEGLASDRRPEFVNQFDVTPHPLAKGLAHV